MKQITNWQNSTVFDIEADDLLEGVTKIWIVGYCMQNGKTGTITDYTKIVKFIHWHIDNGVPLVAHNGVTYDAAVFDKLFPLEDFSGLMVIDTLALSWYLNFKRQKHGLDSFFEDYGIKKVKVGEDEWVGLSDSEEGLLETLPANAPYKKELREKKDHHSSLMKSRVNEDVKINKELWEDLKLRLLDMYGKAKAAIDADLVGGSRVSNNEVLNIDSLKGKPVEAHVDRILTFLMFKMDCLRLQEKTGWRLDLDKIEKGIEELTVKVEAAKVELGSVMPSVPVYTKRKQPANPLKKGGTLSKTGEGWNKLISQLGELDEYGNLFVKEVEDNPRELKVLKSYNPPNINSSQQVKDFLFKHGWQPTTFKYVKDQDAMQAWVDGGFKRGEKPEARKVPQISVDSDDGKVLCKSVELLAEKIPEIRVYSDYNMLADRRAVLRGFIRDQVNGRVKARFHGFSNTLRVKHVECRNLPKPSRPYGELIRGSLIADEGCTSFGTDLSSLEDRVKVNFMIPHDPKYAARLSEKGYDPHLDVAKTAGFVSDAEIEFFKFKKDNTYEPKVDISEFTSLSEGDAYNKVDEISKFRGYGKTGNYACLPTDTTEVLTDSGWKTYSEIDEYTDKVLSYSIDKGCMEFVGVEAKPFFRGVGVVEVTGHGWSFESTDDHRWLTLSKQFNCRLVQVSNLSEEDILVSKVPYSWDSEHLHPAVRHTLTKNFSGGFEMKGLVGSSVTGSRTCDVFCLETVNSTFVIRQGNFISITGNCQYGGSPEAIAQGAGVSKSVGKTIHKGYWKLNWSIDAIAEEQCVITCGEGHKWLVNPVNGFCYQLRKDNDRFSTLCQGTGSYFFDLWVDKTLEKMQAKFGVKKLTACFHDEMVIVAKDNPQALDFLAKAVKEGVAEISEELKLRRELDCDYDTGRSYAEIH